jgi:hypothetical protein
MVSFIKPTHNRLPQYLIFLGPSAPCIERFEVLKVDKLVSTQHLDSTTFCNVMTQICKPEFNPKNGKNETRISFRIIQSESIHNSGLRH